MKRVTGIGGIFFRSKDPKKLATWYKAHLGIEPEKDDASESSSAIFHWREDNDPKKRGYTAWAIFPENTKYFDPSQAQFMINFRVENLDRLLEQLRKEGVQVHDKIEEYEYGKFGWVMDPEGNRIELWEPKTASQAPKLASSANTEIT